MSKPGFVVTVSGLLYAREVAFERMGAADHRAAFTYCAVHYNDMNMFFVD